MSSYDICIIFKVFDIIEHIVLKEEYDILGAHIWKLIQNPENPLPEA